MDNKSSTLTPLLVSGLLAVSVFAQAETTENTELPLENSAEQTSTIEQVEPYNRFVTDRLYVFIHSGSSTRYRIIGRAAAGEEIKVVARDTETGWLQIEQSNGRTGWIEDSVLVTSPGKKAELEQAKAEIAKLQEQLANASDDAAEQTIADLNSEVGNLTLANEDLQRQITELQTENAKIAELEAKNSELKDAIVQTDQTQKILDKLYDVGAVLLGVFAGWILTRRRKSSLSFDRL